MKFSVSSQALSSALRFVQGVVPSRTTLPVLSCVLMEARNGLLTITADSLDMRASQVIPASIEREGESCVPIKQLLASIRGEAVEVDLHNGRITIQSGGRSVLGALPAGDFPASTSPENFQAVEFKELLESLKIVSPVRSSEPERFIINGILMQAGDIACSVATDGRSLAFMKDIKNPLEEDVIIPHGVIACMSTMDATLPIQIGFGAGKIAFRSDQQSVSGKIIEGMYPNWRAVVPDGLPLVSTVKKDQLLDGVSGIMPFIESNLTHAITITMYPDHWVMEASGSEHSSSCDVPCEGVAVEESFKIDATLIRRLVASWPVETLAFHKHPEPTSVITVKSPDYPVEGVLMPLRS